MSLTITMDFVIDDVK